MASFFPFLPPWRAPGFPARGKYTVESLCRGDIEFGRLDGFRYEAGEQTVTVTSRALLERWLRDHRVWWGRHDIPASIPAAFADDGFYTQALTIDAAAYLYGDVPVTASTGADLAQVRLAAFAQDFVMDHGPDTLLAVVIRGDRFFLASARLHAAVVPIASIGAVSPSVCANNPALRRSSGKPKRSSIGSADRRIS